MLIAILIILINILQFVCGNSDVGQVLKMLQVVCGRFEYVNSIDIRNHLFETYICMKYPM